MTRREHEFPVSPADGVGGDAGVKDGGRGQQGIQGAWLVGQVLGISKLKLQWYSIILRKYSPLGNIRKVAYTYDVCCGWGAGFPQNKTK